MKLEVDSACWVDKYKPTHTNELRGQIRNVRRLKEWLASFDPSKSKPILMHGPPGIGKTTAAHLCCKEAGYSVVEMNASDQRNKRVIEDIVRSMTNNSRINFFGRASETKDALIIDEVDGMAGNEDRGGIAQLIQEIKKAKKPIIFISNDGQSRKIRSLVNYCDLPPMEFKRPEVSDIRSVVANIAKKENLKIEPITMDELIEATNRDIRQVVNFLSLFKQTNHTQNFSIKTSRLNPFEATKKAFSRGEPLEERINCFFADYSIIPLFIFENYCRQQPTPNENMKSKKYQVNGHVGVLKMLSKSINAICMGDLVEKQIRSNQNWSLLPLHSILSTALPTAYMNSNLVGRIEFPQFLGKTSNAGKRMRMQQEINSHTCLKIRGGLNADYYDLLRERLTGPLIKNGAQGVDETLKFMEEYSLMREDMDSILDLAAWSFKEAVKIDSKAKAALTRSYKKANISLPYSIDVGATKRKIAVPSFEGEDEAEEEDIEEEEEDEPMPVPVKKPASKPSAPKRAKK